MKSDSYSFFQKTKFNFSHLIKNHAAPGSIVGDGNIIKDMFGLKLLYL